MASSAMSFGTARKILGAKDPEIGSKISQLLGLAALGAGLTGAAGGLAISAAWGWLDQKNELVNQIEALVGKVRGRTLDVRGRERHELVAAAHSAIVTAAFFAGLRDVLGPGYKQLRLTENDKRKLLPGHDPAHHGALVSQLLGMDIALPWAGSGFKGNLRGQIIPYLADATARSLRLFEGLQAWSAIEARIRFHEVYPMRTIHDRIVDAAVSRYGDEYRKLAADVPEFGIWVLLDEFETASDERAVLRQQVDGFQQLAMDTLQDLLERVSQPSSTPPDRGREIIARRNQQVLAQPLAPGTEFSHAAMVNMPTVALGYVEPRFRWTVADQRSRLADEQWWQTQPHGGALGAFLAAYFVSARSAEYPLVILGHPGAGKSLLTKIVAARLPASGYTTVRVPLREVKNPQAEVYQQIQQFLDDDTHLGVRWRDLSAASRDLTRVVFLDGLDELMQATGTTESSYLHQVKTFQDKEALIDSPVATVVTSRTIVANVANVPAGCVVLKLEDFDEAQVRDWVRRWVACNERPIAVGAVKELNADVVWQMGELARQPLLLLMLAILSATEPLPGSEGERVTQAELYRRLLNGFISRELTKPTPDDDARGGPDTLDARMARELWQLGITAFAMFNRGRQSVDRGDLNRDLVAVLAEGTGPRTGRELSRPLDLALRTIARFFFVHAAEVDQDNVSGGSYEFLHATFGEYLIAYHTLGQIEALSVARSSVPFGQRFTDDQLFALLSHKPLSAGGAILPFVRELFDTQSAGQRDSIRTELMALVRGATRRENAGRLSGYNPSTGTLLRRVAVYLANLLMVLTELADEPVDLHALCPDGDEPRTWWRSTVRLVRAGLDDAGWMMILAGLEIVEADRTYIRRRGTDIDLALTDVYEARLTCDRDRAVRAILGATAYHGRRMTSWTEPLADGCMMVVSSLVHRDELPADHASIARLADRETPPEALALLVEYLVRQAGRMRYSDVKSVAAAALAGDNVNVAVRLAPVVAQHPQLLRDFPSLFTVYGQRLGDSREVAEVLAAMRVGVAMSSGPDRTLLHDTVRDILEDNRGARLGAAGMLDFSNFSESDRDVIRCAMPGIIAALADDYHPREHARAHSAGRLSGKHRQGPPLS